MAKKQKSSLKSGILTSHKKKCTLVFQGVRPLEAQNTQKKKMRILLNNQMLSETQSGNFLARTTKYTLLYKLFTSKKIVNFSTKQSNVTLLDTHSQKPRLIEGSKSPYQSEQ